MTPEEEAREAVMVSALIAEIRVRTSRFACEWAEKHDGERMMATALHSALLSALIQSATRPGSPQELQLALLDRFIELIQAEKARLLQ